MMRPLLLLMALLSSSAGLAAAMLSGHDIMHNSIVRHYQYPFIFEAQSMILVDEDGHRDTRQLNRYSRVNSDGTIKLMLRFTDPASIRDTTMLAVIDPQGVISNRIFLPGLAAKMVDYRSSDRNGTFLGSDFSVSDLLPDNMDDYHYTRQDNLKKEDGRWFVVEALPISKAIAQSTGYSRRMLFVRMDNLMIDRIDFYSSGRLIKRMSLHDIRRINGDSWAANMVLMESFQKRHRSMIKINNRIFGKDFVPPSMFKPQNIIEYSEQR
ncbi:MAG: outer membrane lipoprotein-sorting protein [Mariprofundales bacterium]